MDAPTYTQEFLLSFLTTHYSSLAGHLRIKTKQGHPVWIDVQKISLRDLLDLDPDEEVEALIANKRTTTYRDRDY
jgi:hypothetical protein